MIETAEPAPKSADETVWLTSAEVALRFRTKPGTVRYWRHIGFGPAFVKHGRRVLYSAAEIDRYDEQLLAQAVTPHTAA